MTIGPALFLLSGELATEVYRLSLAKVGEVDRGLSIVGQAPLGRYEILSSLLSFKLFASNTLANVFYTFLFTSGHSRVSNPSLGPSFREARLISS